MSVLKFLIGTSWAKDKDPTTESKIVKSNGLIKLGKLNDHRLCMSLFCLSTITGLKSKIKSFETVFTSCPSFLQNIRSIGGGFHVKKSLHIFPK